MEHDFRSQYFVFSQHIPSKVLLVRAVRIEATIVVFSSFQLNIPEQMPEKMKRLEV